MNQRSFFISTPAGGLHILETPPAHLLHQNAPPIVLIHGMVGHAQFWDAALEAGLNQHHTFAVDLRGHGDSTAPTNADYTPTACAADILALLDKLKLDRTVLVGHSYGTLVALATAAAQPEQVANLILVDPPGDFTHLSTEVHEQQLVPFLAALATDEWRTEVTQKFKETLAGGSPETDQIILSRLADTPKDRMLGMYHGMFAFPAVETLDRYLAAPNTQAAVILTPANAYPFSLHVLRPALPAIVIPDVGHWLMMDAPAQFVTALNDCLKLH